MEEYNYIVGVSKNFIKIIKLSEIDIILYKIINLFSGGRKLIRWLLCSLCWLPTNNVEEYYVILLLMNIIGKALLSFSVFQRSFYF